MRRYLITHCFCAIVLLCGCGGGTKFTESTVPSTAQKTPNIAGSWQFSAAPALSVIIAGSITQVDTTVSGALHLEGSDCFDQLTTMSFSGKAASGTAFLTSTAVNGQVLNLTGSFSNTSFVGTYRIKGGCADGQQGKLIGDNIPYIGNQLSGTFTNSAHETFASTSNIAQSANARPDGSFPITGTATFDTPCFREGTIKPGAFPSGSYILGRSVAFEVDTANGVLTFLGTLSQDRSEISGSYSISGGTCDDTGTAVLQVFSAWDY